MKNQVQELQTLSTDLLRALALKQFNGEDYFLLTGIETRAFEGTKTEAEQQYKEYLSGDSKRTDGEHFSFYEWVCENLVEIDELSDDANEDYRVLTDEEADEAMIEEVKNMAWAFNAEFIIEQCGLDFTGVDSLRKMQGDSCEGANDFILSLIEKCTTIEDFAEAAASADGRGHFLARYDGNENEETISLLPYGCTTEDGNDKITFYIYRNN